MNAYRSLRESDPQAFAALKGEMTREEEGLELIASENTVSPAVLDALGSVFTNKYSEGYPGNRYYGGQYFTDVIETLAIDRAKELFGAEHANVQPLSGAAANLAAYVSVLAPGDTVLGMDLSHGGHLTHGHPVTLPAKVYRFVRYKTEADGAIDYEKLEALALSEKPRLMLAGFSSYTRQIDYVRFAAIAAKVGAVTMMDMAHIAGMIAGGALPNPVPHFDIVTATTHKTLRGPRGGLILCKEAFARAVDKAVFPGVQGGPHMHMVLAKAVAFGEALRPEFREYAAQILRNAKAMESEFVSLGYSIVFGTTENHMLLIDTVQSRGVSGRDAQEWLDAAGITLNKNVLPDDPRGPMDPSGVRIGVPAATTRGMKEAEMRQIVLWIDRALRSGGRKRELSAIRREVKALCKAFPIYR
ncbi:MAG: serine hydroxymethyltransferase [Candidatus Moranbacteria bacterium]|nr:serine hydroxymethyltransferase [Candidatus Moranbacteria bacterium]